MIRFFSEYPDFNLDGEKGIATWLQTVIALEKKNLLSVNIIFCTDEKLWDLNVEYLNHDYYTDIITFQYENDPIEGEMYISIDRVKENSLERNIAFEKELARVIVHGVLHLAGYKDEAENEQLEMRQKEDKYLTLLATDQS